MSGCRVSDPEVPVHAEYELLLNGAETRPRPMKAIMLAFVGLMIVGFIAALVSQGGSAYRNGDDDGKLKMTGGSETVPAVNFPVKSRGVKEGVSEKSNWKLLGAKEEDPYDWTNSMLSWQRTAFHFQPEKNWMNDPNGPLYYKGWYHFFYQYNPNDAVWGDIVWGHAVSKDLIHWLHLPIAMVADHWYDAGGVWSGSATILPDGNIVMLYTGSTAESVQLQNLAYPADLNDPLLIDWVKYPGNPILAPPPGIFYKDFRDPTTAWQTSEGKWRITIGSKINKTGIALVYETQDFKSYELLDGVMHAVPRTGMWECIDFFPVSTTQDVGLDTSVNGDEVKHVMKTSLDDTRHDHYALGTYHEKNASWIPDDPTIDVGIGLRYDYGVFYASKTFFDQNKKRRILFGWIGESDSDIADRKKGWASVQSFPRTLLYDKKTGTHLLQWPIKEVEKLRLDSTEFDEVEVKAGSVVPLDVGTATQLDIFAEFKLDKDALERATRANEEFSCTNSGGASQRGALGPFGLLVLADQDLTERTPIYFYVAKGTNGKLKTFFCADQRRSSVANDVIKPIYGNAVPVLDDEKLYVRILVDHSIVESFAQGGRTCITSRVYPTKAIYGNAKLFLFNNATDVDVKASLKIWQMNSAFIRPYSPSQKE